MPDQKTQAEVPVEESSGGLSLEAKAGLTLICLLAAAFSFMVWQKWKEMEGTQVADNQKAPKVQQKEKEGPRNSKPSATEADKKPELELVREETHPLSEASEPEIVALNPAEKAQDSLLPHLEFGNSDY